MTFKDNGTDIKFYLTWNGDVKMSGHLLDFKEDICVTVPIPKIGPLVGICLFFSKYSRVSKLKSYTIIIQLYKTITVSARYLQIYCLLLYNIMHNEFNNIKS